MYLSYFQYVYWFQRYSQLTFEVVAIRVKFCTFVVSWIFL